MGAPIATKQGGTGATSISACLDAAFGSAQGMVLYRDASAWKALGPGTSGQVLQSGGVGANPSWATSAIATAATPASGDNSTKVETTAFSALYGVRGDLQQSLTAAQMAQALANLGVTAGIGTSGYAKLNNGSGTPVIVQWGAGTVPSSGALAISFPVAFPNVLGAVVCGSRGSNTATMLQTMTSSESKTGFQANMTYTSGGTTNTAGNNSFYWFAVGY